MAVYVIAAAVVSLPVIYSVLKVVIWLLKVQKIRKAIEVFVLTKPHWFYGHLLEHPGPNEAGMMKTLEWTEKASDGCYTVLYPLRPTLVLCHPDTVKLILKTSQPKGLLPACGWSYWMFDHWLGNGLLSSNGKIWARKRRLLTPAFHFDILKPYTKIFNECVEKLMDKLEKEVSQSESVEIYEPVSLCTLNAVLRCSFSSTEDVQALGNHSPYVNCVQNLSYYIYQRLFKPLHYFDILYFFTKDGREFWKHCQFSHSVTKACIKKRRETIKEGRVSDKGLTDFLDILLLAKDKEGHGLTEKQIQDEVETFMFGGHDTTASGIAWCLYNLARHPKYQAKARQEVDEIMQTKATVEWEDISRLTYLTMCLKESLRLTTTITFVLRELTEPFQVAGQRIEVGTPIEINFWALHHNSRVWGEDHMTYDPDRFLPNRAAEMDNYAFLPFSAGPRNCIGQTFAMNEMKICVARILHRFEIRLDESHHVEMMPALVTRPKEGIKIFFTKRKA